jgi:hypothetical protein
MMNSVILVITLQIVLKNLVQMNDLSNGVFTWMTGNSSGLYDQAVPDGYYTTALYPIA